MAAWGRVLPDQGTARHSPAGSRGCGRMLPDRGQCGIAQGHQGRLLPAWSAGLCQPGSQWDESRGAATQSVASSGVTRAYLRVQPDTAATGSEEQRGKVLPSRGTRCCRFREQGAAVPRRSVLSDAHSAAEGTELCRAQRREMHSLHAGSPDPSPGCPGQDGKAAAPGPHGPRRVGSRALWGSPGARRCPARG